MLPLLLAPIVGMLAEKGMGAISKLIDKGGDKAIDVISDKLGIDLTKQDVIKSLTPEQEKALREYDLQLKTLDFDREKAYLNDVADARDMQKEALKQEDNFSKRFLYIFASVWSLAAIIYVGAITFGSIPQANVRFADTILGFILGTIISTIINFFFGSSVSSKSKTEALVAMKNEK
jgi:hypothetical protein